MPLVCYIWGGKGSTLPGKPGPVQRSIFVPGFRITPSLSAKLESRVKRLGLSRSEYFRRLIARDVKEKSQ